MLEYQPLEVKQFHGGITDNFIDSELHTYEEADNFIITENQKLYTRPGSVIYDSTNYQIPVGAQRISTLIPHSAYILVQSAKKLYYISGTWQTLQGPTGNDLFSSGTINSVVSYADWNNHTYITNSDFSPVMKVYSDNTSTLRLRSAGLPSLPTTPILAGGGSGTNNYIYSFVYKYQYYVGTVLHVDYGPVTQVQLFNKNVPDVNNVTITAIQALSNGVIYNWDTTVVTKEIYRTIANGTVSYHVTSLPNATTSYVDNNSDAAIELNATIYTDGGELDNDPPPLCKALHITDTLGLYGHIKTSTGQILSNRIRQSKPGDPDSCPEDLFVDLDDSIVAISSAGQTPIVFCERSVYRLDGAFDSQGGGLLQAQEIESTVGCISASSVVQIQRGVVFAGEAGFYFTDGYEVRKLSTAFNKRFIDFSDTDERKRRIYGAFDRTSKRVWWSAQEQEETEVNKCYILDTRYGLGMAGDDLENTRQCFTTASGGDNFRPTAHLFLSDGTWVRADSRGYLFKHSSAYTSDPLINTLAVPSTWDTTPIIWSYKSFATSFGSSLKRKYIPKMVFTADNETNMSLQIVSLNDISKSAYNLKPIRFRKNWTWGDPSKTWGNSSEVWDFRGLIEETRLFNSHGLRCNYKQLQFTNAEVVIVASDDITTVTCNTNTKTATLDDIATYDFPLNLRNYYITFESDSYQRRFKILSHTLDTLTLEDPGNQLPQGSQRWEIIGYPKDEVLNLISYAMWYSYLGEPVQYQSVTAGKNA